METNQPTIGLPVATKTVQAPHGATAEDLLRSLRNPPEGWHSYPFRVFVTSADSPPFGRHHIAVYHVATKTLQVGANTVDGPTPLSVVDTEAPDASAAARVSAGVWLRHAPMRDAGRTPGDSILWCWRELHPGKTTLMHNGAALLPYVYFECLIGLRYAAHRSGPLPPAGVGKIADMCAASRQGRVQSQHTPRWHFRGEYETAERCGWVMKRLFRSPPFVQAVKALKVDNDPEPLLEYLNDRRTFGGDAVQRRLIPATVLVRFVSRVAGGALIVTDCRHVVLDGDEVVTTSGRNTYCPECAEMHFVTTVEGDTEHSDDVYYWDRDGCYHADAEPEDEDDDDEYSPLLASWGASTAYLGHDKSFVPSPHGDFTMGIELEVESVGSRADDLSRCDDHFSGAVKATRRYAMFKRDGSLDEYRGFEIVTAARRLSDHMQAFGTWSPPRNLRAWDADSSCGMHVHVDSRAFTALSLGRFMQLYNDPDNAVFIKAIAGRHPSDDKDAENYAAAVSVDNDGNSGVNPASATKKAGKTRYEMVNLTNLTEGEADRLKLRPHRDCKGDYSTVEVRVFKATTKRARLLAQIEFVHATVIYCRTAGNHELNGRAFLKWLATTAGQYKYLARWFDVFVPKATKQRPTVARNQPVNFVETI